MDPEQPPSLKLTTTLSRCQLAVIGLLLFGVVLSLCWMPIQPGFRSTVQRSDETWVWSAPEGQEGLSVQWGWHWEVRDHHGTGEICARQDYTWLRYDVATADRVVWPIVLLLQAVLVLLCGALLAVLQRWKRRASVSSSRGFPVVTRPVLVVLLLTFVALVAATLWVPCSLRHLRPLGAEWHRIDAVILDFDTELADFWIAEGDPLYEVHHGTWALEYAFILVVGGLLAVALHVRAKRRAAQTGRSRVEA